MKPTNDLFEQQVRGLYEGYEVPAPASTKDAVFNELDSANAPALGSFASKSLLIAVSLLTVGAIYMLSGDTPSVVDPTPVVIEEIVEKVTKSESEIEALEVIEEVAVETFQVIEEAAEVPVEIIEDAPEVVATVVEETVVEKPNVVETLVTEEIKEVAPPIEIVADTPVDEKKEEVEWVLPATIKVEK